MTKTTTNKDDPNSSASSSSPPGLIGNSSDLHNFLTPTNSLNNLNGPPTHCRTHSHPVSFSSSFFLENETSRGSSSDLLERHSTTNPPQSSGHPNLTNQGIHPSSSLTDLLSLNIPPVPVPAPPVSTLNNATPSPAVISSSNPNRTSPGSIPPSAMLQYLDNSPPPHGATPPLLGDSSGSPSSTIITTTPPYEVSQVLENFNALLECLDNNNEIVEDIPGELSSALQQAILNSGSAPSSSSATRIKASVEAFAEMLLSGGAECEDDEDLLIVVDENEESSREDQDDANNNDNSDQEDEEDYQGEDFQDEIDQDDEEDQGVPRPRASMRKLRPVKLKPLKHEESNRAITGDVLVQAQHHQLLSEIPEASSSPVRESNNNSSVTVTIPSESSAPGIPQRSQSRTGSESSVVSVTLEGIHLSSNPEPSNNTFLNGGDHSQSQSTRFISTQSNNNPNSNITTVNINSPPLPELVLSSSTNSSPSNSTTSSSPQSDDPQPPAATTTTSSPVIPPPVPARDPTRRTTSTGGIRRLNSGSNRWPHRLSSVLALIGCTLGLNGICRFGLLSVSYGANFIIQFVILSVAFGIPLLTFHMSIGQYLSSGIVDMWKISPIFQGIGAGLLISQALIGLYTSVGVSWMFIYFRDSFVSRDMTYRWANCVRERKGCEIFPSDNFFNQTSSPDLTETVPDYFNGVVLQRSVGVASGSLGGTSSSSSLKFTVAFNLAVVWMLIFVSLSKGLKSYGKVVHGFVLAPIAALFILAFKMVGFITIGSTLFGQTAWDEFFFNTQTWLVAAREVFFTWGLLGACIMAITSHNKHGHPLKSDAAIVVMVTTLCLLLTAFIANTCYSVITAETANWAPGTISYQPSSFELEKYWTFLKKRSGVMSTSHYSHNPLLMGVRIISPEFRTESSTASGYQVLRLATELFPTTVAILSPSRLSPFWTVLFYGTLVLFGIAQQLAIWHCVIKGIIGIKSKLLRSWETTITFFICGLGFVLGLPFCTETGIFVTYLLDFAIGSAWWIMVLYLLQLVAVFIVRGAPYCGENIVTVLVTGTGRLTRTVAPLLSFVWNVVMPVALLVLSIASFKSGKGNELYDWSARSGYRFWPSWTREVGCLIQLIPLLAVPFVAIIQSCRYLSNGPPDLLQRMQQLYRPTTTLGSGNSSTNGDRAGSASANGRSEDPPPKYTPPPSYSTATGAKIARFLRNSFRRSLRRLGSPGGAGPSSSNNLPPPPNYASVILEIQSQLNGSNQSDESHHPPPPLYAEVTASSSSKSSDPKFQLCQTLTRSELSKERSSLRRIASDLTARDIARMLRASFRRTNNNSSSAAINPTTTHQQHQEVTVETHHQPVAFISTAATVTASSAPSRVVIPEPIPGPSYVFSALAQQAVDGSRNRNSNASTAALIGYDFGSEDTETLDIRTFPRSRVSTEEDLEDYNAAIIRLHRTEESLGLPSHSEA